ncbi:MAG: bifunctional adenosylcobinamide kinase/adenosylcobinamide-phosphate guanylyltransferase [Chloroflexota bacterium]|nr:bifunctional adenosylcobinamide kinase/adenosylcobinamide-phosphate guanylyltransferase [Chloroflexota bacterium]MCY3581767.1 bifunctional adenosylcobinamide kinase/adenosylcobinamide-phosphate guanylyltransferase [Chloroflexota bacterium]MDE2649181.1 bifunctional adenosylcobinamide kinase/adenosylcobinamide-phosphate guanylyltransferase [Chloroflexota bacterium]MXX52331.1 bifunctional adenosylcobinamide kinase/adenosylcobinamide-phosphate guanylyltransferase [Chloroflexota bacterium]MXX8400
MARRLIFLLGGARSGKSRYAENWARQQGGNVLFVATAEAHDDDMRQRIAAHQAARPTAWHTLEAPRDAAGQIANSGFPHDTLILDCVTLLTSHVLLGLPERATQLEANAAILVEVERLLAVYARSNATWLVVSNEVGMGVVPPTRLGVLFRDMLGRANQRIAAQADEALLLVAGLAWKLK